MYGWFHINSDITYDLSYRSEINWLSDSDVRRSPVLSCSYEMFQPTLLSSMRVSVWSHELLSDKIRLDVYGYLHIFFIIAGVRCLCETMKKQRCLCEIHVINIAGCCLQWNKWYLCIFCWSSWWNICLMN